MTAYLLENNIVDHSQLLILVGVIWLKCELGLGVNLQLKHKNIRGFIIWQKEVKLSLLSFWVMKRVFLFVSNAISSYVRWFGVDSFLTS